MKYIIIGDIHGYKDWNKLVEDNAINVFIGDYFDPYSKITFEDLKENFLQILKYAETHKCILLLGNHDLQYWWKENYGETNRFNSFACNEIHDLFMENKDKFQVAYSINNKYLITHAGVSEEWKDFRLKDVKDISPNNLAIEINNLLKNDSYVSFGFMDNSHGFDTYGTSENQSCVWIRPQTLVAHNIYRKQSYVQVVGHTLLAPKTVSMIRTDDAELYFVDCLRASDNCLVIEDLNNNYLVYTKSISQENE